MCCGATQPTHHSCKACTLEPLLHNCCAQGTQLLKPAGLEPVLLNKRSYHHEKPVNLNEESPPTRRNQRKPAHSNKDPNTGKNTVLMTFYGGREVAA